ncbi:MAG: DUF6502 family protein [Gammaproteobacteria bacterium]|nr:DUF6502 family protein [Gammaproteobacteria bacterium]
MAETRDTALRSALAMLLTPLVRILLRNGISHRVFSDIAKKIYVDVADNDFALPGCRQTTSRVAVLTGINRKEVARLQCIKSPVDVSLPQHYNRAVRVISAWSNNPRFKANGRPASLSLDGDNSFTTLVRQYSGDMPVQAVLSELLRTDVVKRLKNGKLRLMRRAYIPTDDLLEKIQILGDDTRNLISTIDHNLQHDTDLRFQREVTFDDFPVDAIEEFRASSARQAQSMLERHYTSLRDAASKSSTVERRRVGVGIYYFELPGEDQP